MMRIINSNDKYEINKIKSRSSLSYEQELIDVKKILKKVKTQGDSALIDYTKEFDLADISSCGIRVTQKEIDEAYDRLDVNSRNVIKRAAKNIRDFHMLQKRDDIRLDIDEGYVIPMLDARRMEVYSAIYNSKLELHRAVKAEILTEESYSALLDTAKVYFIGNGVEKTKNLIQHPNAIFIEGKLPSANEMAFLAELKYKKSDTEDVAYFEPYYLKDFIALKKA